MLTFRSDGTRIIRHLSAVICLFMLHELLQRTSEISQKCESSDRTTLLS
jgi:hypothetical protein